MSYQNMKVHMHIIYKRSSVQVYVGVIKKDAETFQKRPLMQGGALYPVAAIPILRVIKMNCIPVYQCL
jgi:hypothetical protein